MFHFSFQLSNLSADGYYEVQLMTKAVIWYNGIVLWQPPATYKAPTSKIVPEKKLPLNCIYFPAPRSIISPSPGKKTFNGDWKDWLYNTRVPTSKKNRKVPENPQSTAREMKNFLLTFCWNVFSSISLVA